MNGLLCVAAIAAFLVAPNLAIDCSNNRCPTRGLTHTMCKYPDTTPAPDCGIIDSVGLNWVEKTQIIHKHNEVRQFVAAGKERRGNPGPQPAAVYMKTVAWDDELAEIAQRWANQCNVALDECRDVDRFNVGQNSAMIWSRWKMHTTPVDVLMMWNNEVDDMDRNMVNNLTSVDIAGHYTQMVWADTERVGCGKIVYRKNGYYRYWLVCNYGPTGNVLGRPLYLAVV